MTLDANGLRRAFTEFFVERGHLALPGASLVPHDRSILFTIAGMVPFKPYFLGEQTPPAKTVTTIQPSFRMVDIDIIGTTARHVTLFEMLGNFSFGDYFKERAIPLAWELVTEVLGLDPDLLWITVHDSDEEAGAIWQDAVGVAPDRIQKMGEDNFWRMGETGPCGPCSEIYFDRGQAYGDGGGPALGSAERYVEVWNLVFMQNERHLDGSVTELPQKNIDTGAGLERLLAVVGGYSSVFETDVLVPILDEAASITGTRIGADSESDVALRIMADHARAMTFLVADGVFPTNDGRGYVLRRVIRRAALRAHQLGARELATPLLVSTVVDTMREAYPNLVRDKALVETVVAHEEEAFRRTLRQGASLIQSELEGGTTEISGELAFLLHDTFGFPIELTTEIAESRGVRVDVEEFATLMAGQRDRARSARHDHDKAESTERWREILEEFGPSRFVGYHKARVEARLLAIVPSSADRIENETGDRSPEGAELVEVVLDETPFYAEGGGQIGDSGLIIGPNGSVRVLDTNVATEGIVRHLGYVVDGEIAPGELVLASIDEERRSAIRRNHTATHLLQDALRSVLGDHVRQHGSLVAPDRLRFDFNHFGALSSDEIEQVENKVNESVLGNEPVRTYETTRSEAESAGALAIFGEKYGDVVRVVEAGEHSVELCGGTHVHALGSIGLFRITQDSSIGANTRRIEATTGERSLDAVRELDHVIERVARSLHTSRPEVPYALDRLIDERESLENELDQVRRARLSNEAAELIGTSSDGRVVARRDGLGANDLRDLALRVREGEGIDAVGLIGLPEAHRVSLVVASRPGSGIDAKQVASQAARLLRGGGGGSSELATAGGRDVSHIKEALDTLKDLLKSQNS